MFETFYTKADIDEINKEYLESVENKAYKSKYSKGIKVSAPDTFRFGNEDYYTKHYDISTDQFEFPITGGMTPFIFHDTLSHKIPTFMDCRYDRIMLGDKHIGELPILKLGGLGSGKSMLIDRDVMIHLALGYKVFTMCDLFNETRNIIKYGFFPDGENFQPFHINYLLPEGYKFKSNTYPIWDHRDNVSLIHYSNMEHLAKIIINSEYTVNSIYVDCYNADDKLKLYIVLYEHLRRMFNSSVNLLFYHHELSQLFPNNMTSSNAKLLDTAADRFVESRKARIRVFGALQIDQELYYRFGYKFPTIFNFQTGSNNATNDARRDAMFYQRGQCNIEHNGLYMRHYFYPLQQLNRDLTLINDDSLFEIETILDNNDLNYITPRAKPKSFSINEFKVIRDSYVQQMHENYPELTHSDIGKVFSLTQRNVGLILNKKLKINPKLLEKFNQR